MFPAHGYSKYTVVKDTVIGLKQSKIVNVVNVRYNGDTLSVNKIFVREDSSKVYYYSNGTFHLMYDFTLNVGDTLRINTANTNYCDSVSPLIVGSIKTIIANGGNLQKQFIKDIYFYNNLWGGTGIAKQRFM